MRMRQRIVIATWCLALGWSAAAAAQQQPAGPASEEHDVIFLGGPAPFEQAVPGPEGGRGDVFYFRQGVGPAAGVLAPAQEASAGAVVDQTFRFISAVGFGPAHTVMGAPYSAVASTEIVQTLADGNRIVRKMTASVYRDSEGRTRRDQTLGALGPWVATNDPPQISFISYPVAKVQYVLDHKAHWADKSPPPPSAGGSSGAMFIQGPMPPGAMPGPPMSPLPAPVTEDLGKQTIEGVETDGTRRTVTIPAGSIGNELPIQIVSERWYSPALQEVMLSINSDPRSGTTTYKLTSLSRNEPARSLFEVPPGYTLTQPPIVSASGFADCVAAGNPVAESMPRTCRTADGKTYIEPPPGPGVPGSMPSFNRVLPPPRP